MRTRGAAWSCSCGLVSTDRSPTLQKQNGGESESETLACFGSHKRSFCENTPRMGGKDRGCGCVNVQCLDVWVFRVGCGMSAARAGQVLHGPLHTGAAASLVQIL